MSWLWGWLFVHSRPLGRRTTRWLYRRYLRSKGTQPRDASPAEAAAIARRMRADIERLLEQGRKFLSSDQQQDTTDRSNPDLGDPDADLVPAHKHAWTLYDPMSMLRGCVCGRAE